MNENRSLPRSNERTLAKKQFEKNRSRSGSLDPDRTIEGGGAYRAFVIDGSEAVDRPWVEFWGDKSYGVDVP